MCHPVKAQCVDNHCHCKSGYVGDGYQCTESHPGIDTFLITWAYEIVWYGMWYGMVWCGMVWYGMVCGVVWYGMVWHCMV